MPEIISLTEFRHRLGGLGQATAQEAWKRGRLVGKRTGITPNSPIELDWVASVKKFTEDSTVYKLHDYQLIDIRTNAILWEFKPEELQQYTFLQRVKPKNQNVQLSTASVEGELKNLQEFAKLGLQVYDNKGNVRSIIALAREQEALFKAKRAQLDFEKEMEKLIDIATVQKLVANMGIDTCKAILAVPDRVSAVLSTMDDDTEIHRYLTDELNYALNNLSLEMEKVFNGSTVEETDDSGIISDDAQLSDVGRD